MRPAHKRIVDTVVNIVIVSIGAVMAGWGSVLLLDGLDIKMAGAPLPQSLPYLPLAIGGALMVVFALARGVSVWTKRSGTG